MVSRRSVVLGGLILLGSLSASGQPAGLPRPVGPVILTVTGAIARTNGPRGAEFDRGMLEDLGLHSVVTWTPWTDGEVHFEGVLARDLMEAVGPRGTQVEALALNDFSSTMPLDDFGNYDVLFAMYMNEGPLRVRDKGPLWIIYPWSDHPALDDFTTREKSVWQLSALRVL